MKRFLLVFPFVSFVIVGCATEQPRFRATGGAVREAIARGEGLEALSALETQAVEAEKNKDWVKAASAYNFASDAARNSGQLQKAISYGNKGIELAERGKEPVLHASAILYTVYAYRAAGQNAKAREWMDKGLALVKKLDHSMTREILETNFYRMLGADFLR